jgi:hypothetical protein
MPRARKNEMLVRERRRVKKVFDALMASLIADDDYNVHHNISNKFHPEDSYIRRS